ncbi:hypothetical protein U9M48_012296 [Paspalum notatum var. saurae]|uniref:Pectinesterase inhibitor domain-containing protein n=1 Tax=Paspalum notatum var. saurae TaxID=547442 RepID=A0AAQ3SZL8_PASNO
MYLGGEEEVPGHGEKLDRLPDRAHGGQLPWLYNPVQAPTLPLTTTDRTQEEGTGTRSESTPPPLPPRRDMAMARSIAHLFFFLLLVSTAPAVRTISDANVNIQAACNKTLFPKVCLQALKDNPESPTATPRRLAELSVYVTAEVGMTVAAFAHHELNGIKDTVLYRCLDTCSEDIEEAVAHLSALTRELTDAKFLEVKSWLSSTLGGTSTCEDACKDAPVNEVKNACITKSFEFEKLLRVTLDLITEASGSMSAEVALPPTTATPAASAPSPFGGDGSPAEAPAYGAPSPGAPAYGGSGAGVPAPSVGPSASAYNDDGADDDATA